MAQFLQGDKINAALVDIFEEAEKHLVIISPFIKLHSRVIDVLKSKKDNDRLKITVVFGKNEGDLSKSLSKDDFVFLKDFPNIEMKYESRLHAKYYANESSALLSSMNLYDYSQNNNIEFGILTRTTFTSNIIGSSLDNEAYFYFEQVAANSETHYERIPAYQDRLGGLRKTYTHSDTTVDELSKVFGIASASLSEGKKQQAKDDHIGYCIRTGEKITFNPDRPFSATAFKSWSKYKDENYREKYCHFSGELSNGETSYAKPILRKNWTKTKA